MEVCDCCVLFLKVLCHTVWETHYLCNVVICHNFSIASRFLDLFAARLITYLTVLLLPLLKN